MVQGLAVAAALFRPHLHERTEERLLVAHLDAEQRVLGLWLRATRDPGAVLLPMRQIVADAIRLHGASVILAHNHPSGDPEPSATDIEATRSLAQVIGPLDLIVRDHLVFGGDRVVSFRQRLLL